MKIMKTAFILLLGFGGLTTFTCNSGKSKGAANMNSPKGNVELNSKIALFGPIIVKSQRTV